MSWIVADSIKGYVVPGQFLSGVTDGAVGWALVCVLIVIVQGAAFLLRSIENPGFVQNLRDALFRHIMDQDMAYFDRTSTGVLISRLSEDVIFVLQTYADKLDSTLQNLAGIASGIVISFVITWRVTLLVVIIVPIAIATYYISEYKVNKLWKQFSDRSKSTTTQAEEVITAFRTVKSFNRELYESQTYARGLTDVHEVVVRASHVHAVKGALLYLFSTGITAPVIYYCGYLALRKPYLGVGLGDLITISVCLQNAAIGVSQCITSFDDLRKAAISAAKLLLVRDE
jgi:ABC-type multidrug transport system fused ATPase/permease subunit